MKTTCGIVKDLLPLYIDGVCSEESKALVQAHLSECEKCQKYHEAMRMTEQNAKEDTRDMKLENGLKNLKSRVNRRILKLGLAAAALLVCILAGKHMLFDAPLKQLGPEDVHVNAKVYATEELTKLDADTADGSSVKISRGDDAQDESYNIVIPFHPDMEFSMTESAIEGTEYITIIDWQSKYLLREINWRADTGDEDVIYISSIRTSLLNNTVSAQKSTSMEMRRISKIVYVENDGTETLLWEAAQPADAISQ